MTTEVSDTATCALAALSICEAMLVALVERQIIPGFEAEGILEDAASALDHADEAGERKTSEKAARIIRAMLSRNACLWVMPQGK